MARSDALENRARIIDVARSALADDAGVSMNRIAQLAGVGAGTLYRNFPNRESLVLAIYEVEVQRLLDGAPRLLTTHAPVDALRIWTRRLVDAMLQKHGLGDALGTGRLQSLNERTYGPVIATIGAIFDAGKQRGDIRPDAHPDDFLQLTGSMWRAKVGDAASADRMLELVIDGLTAHRRT